VEDVRIPWKTWVLVCDGAKALLLRNDGDATLLNLVLLKTLAEPAPATHELGSDKPGRTHESMGYARSAMEQTDWHAQAEAAFLRGVAGELDKAVRENGIKALVLVAPPKALGLLRKELTDSVQACVKAEIPKDLARLSTRDIEKHLANA
jgi:protein required for attachment to host cells